MSSHIETLAKRAMAKQDDEDPHHITRVILNEFSLYPHRDRGPLSLVEFHSLQEKVNEIARHYPQNLHLLLSSIPVKINRNEVINLVMYVQCGEHPIIHTSTKARVSDKDAEYPNTKNRDYSSDDHCKNVAGIVFGESKNETFNLIYGGDILFRVDNTQVRTTIDICLDNLEGIGKARLTDSIAMARGAGSEALPTQVDHVVTSNSIDISKDQVTSSVVTQADPFVSHYEHSLHIASEPLPVSPIKQMDIPSPAFGSYTIMKIFPPRPFGSHLGELAKQVEQHNEFIVKLQALYLYRENRPQEMDL
jgi:hypothetical protein